MVLFFKTLYSTDPFPVPLLPEVMVIQEALLTAVQVQFEFAVTLIELGPPAASNAWLVGKMELVQVAGVP